MVEVRIARNPDELEQFRRLEREYDEELPPDLRHDAEESLDDAFLAWKGSEAVGCIATSALDEESAILKRLYVRAEHRKSGAGRALTQACVELARERGYRRIVLDTNKEHLEAAYRLYRSMGFRECAPYGGVNYRCPTYMELVFA